MHIAVLIPSLEPSESLCSLIAALQAQGLTRIVLIDDGSTKKAQPVFDRCAEQGCLVVRHPENRGKGAALRTGLRAAMDAYPELAGVVTADADGQHAPEDILRIAQAVVHANGIVMGVRDFSAADIPLRSRFGNRFSSLFFRLSSGISCPDTQTGLRGIPHSLFPFALSVPGDRYEYEMNTLFTAAQKRISLQFIPIRTIYEDGNQVSHFRPIRDSARIYAMPLRFLAASLGSFVVDMALFALFVHFLPSRTARAILTATIGARICSGVFNFVLNRNWSFRSREGDWRVQAFRYLLLFLAQMLASGGLVTVASVLPLPLPVLKLCVDSLLFCISYFIQRGWVFRSPD